MEALSLNMRLCVTAKKISDQPKVEDEGKRVIFPTFSLHKSDK